jgi:hypothetical protein
LLYKLQRRDELDRQIEQLAELPALAPMVRQLQCFRGISLHSAMVLATEIVDWRRFERPARLACYLGPSRAKTRVAPGSGSARSRRRATVTRRRGSKGEHARRRYAACAGPSGSRIPEPRMIQLPTHPILAALPSALGNRRISAGSTVDAASRPRRATITLHRSRIH